MVVYKLLKSKAEMDLASFLIFSLSDNLQGILHNPKFFMFWIKEVFVMKIFYDIKINFDNFRLCIREWLCAAFFSLIECVAFVLDFRF